MSNISWVFVIMFCGQLPRRSSTGVAKESALGENGIKQDGGFFFFILIKVSTPYMRRRVLRLSSSRSSRKVVALPKDWRYEIAEYGMHGFGVSLKGILPSPARAQNAVSRR